MDLVIDANIIFAALIKDDFTRFLLFRENITLCAPEFIFTEIEKYSKEIYRKSGRTHEELENVLNVLIRRIHIIPKEEIIQFIAHTKTISPDPKDVPYMALPLKRKIPIWSNDKKLKNNQKTITVYTTEEINKKTKQQF